MLEWFALILLTFAIYRFQIRDYTLQIVATTFLLSLLSYLIIVTLELRILATLVQPIVVFLFYWILFKVPIYYAGLCVVNGYLGYCVIQSIIFYVFSGFGTSLLPATPLTFVAQTVTAITVFLVVLLATRSRLGFSFVEQSEVTKIRLQGTNLKLLMLTLAGYAVLSSFNFIYYLDNYKIIMVLLMFSAFAIIQYWTFQKEYESSHWHRARTEMRKNN
jgi:hypothetical protein